ncbi:MAG: hypothetical protein GWO24_22280 [Akkermansiaceae bacterium]|nr:hypothetical protein [Akkermansiaceae bacterium]
MTGPVSQGGSVVIPRSGVQMLQFLHTNDLTTNDGTNGDMYYLFDLSHLSGLIATGGAKVSLGAYFNAGASGLHFDPASPYYGRVDNAFFVGLSAWTGDVAEYPATGRNRAQSPYHLATDHNYLDPLVTDRDESTWEYESIELNLPVGTTYVAARIAANENVYRNSSVGLRLRVVFRRRCHGGIHLDRRD